MTTNRERLTLKVQTVEEDRIVGVTIEPNLKEKRPPGIGVELAYPAAATSEAGMTDLQMLEVLEPLMTATESPDRQIYDDRTALLDHLRAPLAVPPESGLPRE